MNYYEELGLTPGAPVEEIRHAYKNLARLLHPDQHSDGTLRKLAELQMKRLNAIHAVLTDAGARRAYDLSLDEASQEAHRRGPGGARAAGWGSWLRFSASDLRFAGWLAGLTVLAAALFWVLSDDAAPKLRASEKLPPRPEQATTLLAAPVESPSAETLARELSLVRRRVEVLEVERNLARVELANLRLREPSGGLSSRAVFPQSSRPAFSLPEPPAMPSQASLAEALADSRSPVSGPSPAPLPQNSRREGAAQFAGTWFYTPPRVAAPAGSLYPAEYIQADIVEETGGLRGRYYGRYRVTDRAISPEVIFSFEGRPQQDAAVLEWRGGGGARGEIRLKLLSENSMEVSWSATQLGSSPGLASGTAVLVRRIE